MRCINLKCIFVVIINAQNYVTQIYCHDIDPKFFPVYSQAVCVPIPPPFWFLSSYINTVYTTTYKMSLFSSCFKISSFFLAFSSLIMPCFCLCHFVIAHRTPRLCSLFSILFSVFSLVFYWVIFEFTDNFPCHLHSADKPI